MDGGELFINNTTIGLRLVQLEQTALIDNAIDVWDDKNDAKQTYSVFKIYSKRTNKCRLEKLSINGLDITV